MRETQNSHRTHGKRQSTGFASRCVNAPLKLSEMPAQPEYLDDDDNEGDGGIRSARSAASMILAGATRIGTSSGIQILDAWDESIETEWEDNL